MTNEAGGTKELYYSNGGMINLDTNKITPEGGLEEGQLGGRGLGLVASGVIGGKP